MADDFNSDLEQIRKFNELAGNAYIPVNLSRDRGNVLTDRNQIILDRSTLNPFDFAKKYGADVAREMDQLDLSQATTALMQDDDRNTDQLNYDLVNNIASGVNNTLGGIAVFGASAISPNTGAAASELLNNYNEWNRSLSTEDIQNSAELDSIRASLDKQDSIALFEEERRTVGDFTAGLNMFGRDALQAAVRMTEDPRTVETLAEQGIGSLLAAGPTAKALGAIGQAVAKIAGIETGLISAQSMLPATIGMMEGGNAFSSAVGEVLDTSFEDLEKTSPEFREMVANGMSKDAARRRLATRAGYVAEAIQTPIAAAAGTLVSKFEAAPLAAKPITDLVQNVAREGLEEGIQSATGQIAQNVGIKTGADPEKDMLEDVAAGTVQGAVSGSLSAGVPAAPGAAFKTVVDAAKSAGQNLDKLLLERANRVKAANDAASPVSDEKLTAAAEELPTKATEVATAIAALVPPDADEASKAEAASYAERIVQSSTISPENLAAIPEHIRAKLPESNNLFVTLKGLGDIVADEENTKADRVTAVLSILSQMAANENLLGDLPSFLEKADKKSDQYKQFEDYYLVLNNLRNSPSVAQAMQWAMEGNLQQDVEITPERAATPEGQQDIQNAINIAENIPSAVNEKVNDQILYMADRGDITLTDIQRKALLSAKAILDAQRAFEKEMGSTEGTPYITQAAETVSKQIETEGGARPYQYSLEGHVKRISEAKGNKSVLKDRLRGAVMFAMHMRNKANSLAQAIANGDGKPVPYKTLGNKGWLEEKKWNSVYYIPGNENSKKIAQRIHAEASAMASLSNSLKALYPEYNIPEITIPAFNLEGEIAPTVTAQESESETGTAAPEVNSDSQTRPEPELVQSEPTEQVSAELEPETVLEITEDAPVEPSEPVEDFTTWEPRTLIAAIERTKQEQNKRLDLLGNAEKLKEYAKDKGISVKELNDLLTENLANNTPRLLAMEKVASSKQFLDLQQKAKERASNISFNDLTSEAISASVDEETPTEPEKASEDTPEYREANPNSKGYWETEDNYIPGEDEQTVPPSQTEQVILSNLAQFFAEVFDVSPFFNELPKVEISKFLLPKTADIYSFVAIADNQKFLWLPRNVMEVLKDNEHPKYKLASSILLHEFLHVADDKRQLSSNKNFQNFFEKEFANAPKKAKQFFESYALTHKDNSTKYSEVFAEFGVFHYMNMGSAAEIFPETLKVFENLLTKKEEETTTKAPKEKLKLNLKATYPDLLGLDNRFRKSFTYPGDAVSRLVTSADPIADVQEVLDAGQEAIEGIAGTKIQYTLNDDHIEAYTELLDHAETMVNTINSNLQAKLDEKLKNGKTLRELINSGDESSLYWATTRPFAIMEKDGQEFKYNDNLLRSAVLAGLDWAINDYLVKGYDDEDAIAKATGINVASFPSAMLVVEEDGQQKLSPIDFVNEYNLGMSFARAKRDIARKIQSFWGVNVLPDADIGHAQGILEGIAGEVMTALEEEGFFTGETLTINYEVETKGIDGKLVIKEAEYTLHRYRNDKRNEPTKDLFKSFNGAKRLLGDLVVVDNQHEFYVDRLPPAAPEFQLRSQVTKNSKKARKALDIQASRPFYLDNSFADFIFEGVGRDAVMSFLGGWPGVNPRYVNGQHLRTIEGVNTTISSAYDTTEAHIEEIKNIAKTKGVDPSEIPSYYSNNMTSVGRLQFDGPSNVQSDKLSRHLISSTKEVVDITDPEMLKRVWMTVGQGLGIKTEYQYGENVQRDAVRMTLLPPDGVKGTGKFYKAVSAIEAWYKEPNKISAKRALNEVITASGGDNSIHLLFSLHQAARIKMALDNGTGKEFVNYGYLEADGKTNGLANALVMLNGNMFSGSNLAKLERIGLFIGSGKKTLADYFATKAPETPVDLYTAIAKKNSTYLQEYADSIADNKEVKALYDDMITIFKELDIGISFNEDGNIEISRNVTKNPSTITIYGSGSNGIAGNIASELVKMVYAEVTAAMQANAPFKDTFTSAWDRLLTSSIYKNKSGELKVYNSGKKRGNRQIGPDYALSYTDFKNLRGNLHEMFIKHMVKAIDEEVMNDVLDSTNLIQRTTNAQSIVLNTLFNAEIVKFIAEKKKAGLWKDGDFLSRNELKQIQNKLEKFAPTLTVGDQNYYLSAGETTEIARNSDGKSIKINGETVSPPKEFGSDLAGKYRSAAYYFGPGILGVGGMPKLNIGNGDGQMMITAIADYGVEGLPVFDGFHMRPSRFDKDSEAMNRAVFDTWQNNPMRSLSEAFAQFVEAGPVHAIEQNNLFIDDFIENMSRNYNGPGGAIMTFHDIMEKFEADLEDMQEIARNHDIRVIATNMLSVSVDQMSSAGTPYFVEGTYPSEITSVWSHEDKATVLNKVIYYLEGKGMPKDRVGIPQGMTLDLDLNEYRPKLPEAKQLYYAEDDGVQVISTNDLPVFIDTLQKRVSKQHKEMLTNTLKRLKDSGYKVVFGLPSELRRWENRNFPMNTDGVPYEGKTDIANKVIYISNENVETIVHELIHAATFDKVNAFYKNKGSLSATDSDAIGRIEGLMKEWLAAEPEGDVSVEFEQANEKALLTIRDRLSKGQKAAALNEFMAWSLANKDLADVQKTVKVKSPVLRIVGDALMALWRLIWGNKFAPVPGDTIYSNLRFNTRVLLATPYKGVQVAADLEGISLYQSAAYGNNDRINALTVKLVQKINSFIQSAGNLVDVTLRQKEYQSNLADALDTTQVFMAQGFSMNMQEKFLFQVVQALLATNAKVNTNSLSAIQDIYAHVMENLKVEDFMQDRTANEPADRYQAQKKYDTLTGVFGTKTDSSKRSNLMPTFLALAMVDEQFRSIINGMPKPAKFKSSRESWDRIIENLGVGAADLLGSTMSTAGANLGLLGALDALVNELGGIAADQQSFIEQNISKTGDAFDDYVASWRDKTGKKLLDANKGKTGAKARAARLIGTLFNDEASSKWVDGIISKINKADGLNTVRELVAEIVGPKADNASFYRMINRVRAAIQQTRQQYREHLPERLTEAFSRKLTSDEWSLMFKGFAKTDLSALFDHIGLARTINMIGDNTARANLIEKLEADLIQISPRDAAVQMRKAKDLAEAMITGKTSTNHLRNAYAVAHMLNERTSAIPGSKEPAVSTLDQLITLYAVDNLPANQRKSLNELINSERKGVEKTLSFLIGERRDELAKTTGRAKINGYKGYIPSDNQLGVSLIVEDDQKGAHLRSMGYVRLGDYRGSAADTSRISRGYYFSPVSGKATYNQGVLQTVHQTASGVDPHTGYSMDLTAGRITHRDTVNSIARNMANTPAGTENLHPIFDTNGDVIAYERGIDPDKLTHLNRNTDLSQMMGAWVGRQIEEHLAYHFNRQLIDVLKKHYDEGKAQGRGDEYIDLISSKDPIHQDTWALFPNSTRDEIKAVFGDKFMIRKDMLNDAVGYREASIGDLWTGNTRMKPAVAEAIRKRLIGMFGEKAFSYFVNAEKFVQNVVTEAKVLIVVKSVIVPLGNMVSNIHQLMLRGVPIRSIIHGLGSKTAELNDFIKRRKRQLELEVDLRSAEAVDNSLQMRRIENELRAIKDSYKRMSIYPLIEAGEFSSISDGGITQEDIALSEGRWGQFIEKLADKVPDVLKVPAKYALLTRDTALFQGLTRAVQYGDFLGKAILYDDLVNRKKINRDDALTKVSEEFVNYNRLAGRNRNYLESIGLMWFWNFKLRSIRTAVSMIRENPFRAFMYSAFGPDSIPLAGDIGSPIEDNALAIIGQGKAGFSIGPAMGLGSWSLNPLVNILH